jgi:regulator of sirC expression with transglutaminase-like and TPR domain
MSERLRLTLFAHVCARPEAELDLGEAALLIAEAEYPGLDVARYVRALDDLARSARAALDDLARTPDAAGEEARLSQVVRYLYEDAGFHGNDDDYYDPRNSFLNEVIDRRTGIPITLAVALTEVCRRAGVAAHGVSFPGHFLVRVDTPRGAVLIDPFSGHPLTHGELRALYMRATGEDRDPPPRLLEPATKAQILARILNNLRGIYESRHDDERLRGVLERVHVLAPSEALRQRIAELGGSTPWRSSGGGVN